VISADPELRDLKKESTNFVPAALRKKRAPVAKPNPHPHIPSGSVADGADHSSITEEPKQLSLAERLRAQLGKKASLLLEIQPSLLTPRLVGVILRYGDCTHDDSTFVHPIR
jgi:hypothetical protein